ncbi:MAG TPA: hypothetical protein VGL10_00635, partial [Gammaproteobacteria bacterium]
LGPVVLGVLFMLAILGLAFFVLYVHRVQTLHRVDYSVCAQYKTYIAVSKCVGLKVRDYLKHPQWQAAQFASYMLAAIIGGIFCTWFAGAQYSVTLLLVAAISALVASLIFKPWGLVAMAALLGTPLGGAIFNVFVKKRGIQNTNS